MFLKLCDKLGFFRKIKLIEERERGVKIDIEIQINYKELNYVIIEVGNF